MGLVDFVLSSIGICAELVCFLLDLNFIIVHSLIRFVVACLVFVNNLPALLTNLAVGCWDFVVFCTISLADGAAAGAQGAVNVLGGALESLKMAAHLSSHACLRGRELLYRGALSAWEACGGAVDTLLVCAQSLYCGAVGAWQAVSSPVQTALELTVTLAASLYSSLVSACLFLWSPCSWALETLFSVARILLGVFILNVYGLLLTSSVSLATGLYLNPALARRLRSAPVLRGLLGSLGRLRGPASRIPGALRRLRRALWRLYVQERDVWRRMSGGGRGGLGSRLRLGLGLRPPGRGDDGRRVAGDGDPGGRGGAAWRAPPDGRAGAGGAGPPPEEQRELAVPGSSSSSTDRPLQKLPPAPPPDGEPRPGSPDGLLSLLKDQEERRKCVICQDRAKTVVLLPCRHLCLCRDCTGVLLRQPVYLQNCPLCRHMILSTMDVYL